MSLLNEIQQKLKVPKGQYNKFSEFYYRNAEDIMEAVKPLLGAGSLILSDEIVLIGERYYIKATAYLSDGDKVWTATGWARETLERPKFDGAQLTGAASSYARKYALNGLFCIDDTKDADTQAPEAPKQALPATKPVFPVKSAAPAITNAQQAAKDRIKAALAHLGEPNDTRKEVEDAVLKHVDMLVTTDDLEVIGDKLWAKVENTVDPLI